MSNRLSNALSPYLLQHADNPVDWWEWGPEAFAEARRRDVPVFLSVGYAACHWCHVMAHESFEDPQVANMLNEGFVSIKVDREERPDIDAVYMAATTALTGHGGWPMSVWLDHDGRPFYAGTYFPAEPRHLLPSFTQLLEGISSAWRERRGDVLASAARVDSALKSQRGAVPSAPSTLDIPLSGGEDWRRLCQEAVNQLATSFDPRSAGFGRAPKFPPSMVLEFLLRAHALADEAGVRGAGADEGAGAEAGAPSAGAPGAGADADADADADAGAGALSAGAGAGAGADEGAGALSAGSESGSHESGSSDDGGALDMATSTFEAMARGGMYDQLRGGFARYSVDAHWVVPHFEKMLYDNALLLRAYAHWWRASASPLAARVVRETVEFLLADMRTEQGGFAASLDADAPPPEHPSAPAREGASYVWRPAELRTHLGDDDGDWVASLCEVTERGTFEDGASTLQLLRDPDDLERWATLRARLLTARNARPQPARDDKVVAAWNGLTIAALADAGDIFEEPAWVEAAAAAADLLLSVHIRDDGTLARVSRNGRVSDVAGVLADYGDVAEGLLALYRATGDQSWYLLAQNVLGAMVRLFYRDGLWVDHLSDGLLPTSADPSDNAEPSGASAAVSALLSLAALGGSVPVRHLKATDTHAADTHAAEAHAAEVGDSSASDGTHRDLSGGAHGQGSAAEVVQLVAETVAGQETLMRAHPRFAGQWLNVAAALAAGPLEVAVVADTSQDVLRRIAVMSNSPGLVIAFATPGDATEVPLLHNRVDAGSPRAYVCTAGACQLPASDPQQLRRQIV